MTRHAEDRELQAAAAGEAVPEAARRHIEGCARCRAERDAYARLRAALARVPRLEAPPDLARAVMSAWREEARRTGARADADRGSWRRSLAWFAAADAALVAVVALAWGTGQAGGAAADAVSVVVNAPTLAAAAVTVLTAVGVWVPAVAAAVAVAATLGLRASLGPEGVGA